MKVYVERKTGRWWAEFFLPRRHGCNSPRHGSHLFAGLWYGSGRRHKDFGKIDARPAAKRMGYFGRTLTMRPARFLKLKF